MFVMQLTQPFPPNNTESSGNLSSGFRLNETTIGDLLADNRLTCHFQPIINRQQGTIFAYEALCRTVGSNPFDTIEELFTAAGHCGMILPLDMRCRENAMALASAQGLANNNTLLFINICPTSLLHPDHSAGSTGLLANRYEIPRATSSLKSPNMRRSPTTISFARPSTITAARVSALPSTTSAPATEA
jgi:hypothetical protein